MSWHFSLELVADYLRATSSVGKRSVLLSADNIPETLCSNGKLLFYREPKVTRFEPHNNAAIIEAAMMEQGEQ